MGKSGVGVKRIYKRQRPRGERETTLVLYDFPDSISSALRDSTLSPLTELEAICFYYSNNREP